jgi:hypothetical protein
MSVLICSVRLDKIVSNRVKASCIILINVCFCVLFAKIVRVSILFLLSWTYDIFGLPSVFWHAPGLSFCGLSILACGQGEANLLQMIY